MGFNRRAFLKSGVVTTTTSLLPQAVAATTEMNGSFVETDGHQFQLDGQPFTMVGSNNFWMSYLYWDKSLVDSVMQTATELGFNTLRTWGFGSGSQYLYQPAPGEYNEEAFKRMDYIIKRASDYGLKLIVALTNYWADFGGMPQFVDWSDTATERDDFYTDDACKGMYRNYVRDFLTRTNTYTGREYRDEPAIAIWELANEARCPSAPDGDGSTLHSWMDEMAGHVKSIDPNHLVSTGSEGFVLGEGAKYDDVAYWMNTQGSDFVGVHQSSHIDVASFHLYPDHWQISKDAARQFIKDRAEQAKTELNKPVYLGEFGRAVDRNATDVSSQIEARNTEYQSWYDIMESTDVNGRIVWQLVDDSLYGEGDQFSIYYPRDGSTLDVLENAASTLGPTLTVQTGAVTGITESEATLNGEVTELGGATSVDVAFEFREVNSTTWTTTELQTLSATGTFSTSLQNLNSGTEYEFRALVTTGQNDTTTGAIRTFSTQSTAHSPRIDRFSVSESGSPNPHAEINATWAVSDVDADLQTVDLVITDFGGNQVKSTTIAVSGETSSGSESIFIKKGGGTTYNCTLKATDERLQTTSETTSVSA